MQFLNLMSPIAEKVIALKNADLALRDRLLRSGELHDGYHPAMRAIHDRNAEILDDIIDRIGYPTVANVGKAASAAAWLVIQHAVAQPAFIKKCAKLLAEAVENAEADPLQLAYLTDRIAVFSDRPQLYGTQFDWDAAGNMSPNAYDNAEKVNARRAALGLNTLAEQTDLMRERAKKEGGQPPSDAKERKAAYDVFRKDCGWIE